MKALDVVVNGLNAGITPSTAEYSALLSESGFDRSKARALSARYSNAIAAPADDEAVALLKSFRLG